jgi:hypothetical protein
MMNCRKKKGKKEVDEGVGARKVTTQHRHHVQHRHRGIKAMILD